MRKLLLCVAILLSSNILIYSQTDNSMEVKVNEFQTILDSANVSGSILIYDNSNNKYFSNDFAWSKEGYLPASTFKIPNSIIALETGIIKNENSILKWDGIKRSNESWNKDMTVNEAFMVSCVPCYQEIARKIGSKRMNEYLKKFNYGNMSVADTNIDIFWLEGNSKISQYQQIEFLRKFYFGKLPIAKRTEKIMKKIMRKQTSERYKLSGKTGWAIRNGNNIGWFVGYLEVNKKVWFIATNIVPKEKFNMDMFARIRQEISLGAFKALNIIPLVPSKRLLEYRTK